MQPKLVIFLKFCLDIFYWWSKRILSCDFIKQFIRGILYFISVVFIFYNFNKTEFTYSPRNKAIECEEEANIIIVYMGNQSEFQLSAKFNIHTCKKMVYQKDFFMFNSTHRKTKTNFSFLIKKPIRSFFWLK